MELLEAPDHWLSRFLFERALAGIYLIAFLVARNQFRPLLGEHGLLPVPRFVRLVPFRRAPSLFHRRYSDRLLAVVAGTGMGASALLLLGLPQRGPVWLPMLAWFACWALYLSIVNVGQTFYAFGWESLLLDAGFAAIFLGPSWAAPPAVMPWLLRWLLFRLEFGAGLIKIRGDPCWRDLTCLFYHHETQPMPNPLSWYFHRLPRWVHRLEVAGNHVLQLVVPFGLFAPQPVAAAAGLATLVHQSWLILSGNFSWLNWMAVTLAVWAFTDGQLDGLPPLRGLEPAILSPSPGWFQAAALAYAALVVVLSWFPVRNMLSRRQLMNYSFNPLHLVNTYGAFGSITRERYEIAIEGTADERVGPATEWREYGFKGKPGHPRRRPPQVAPYHLRLDWLMWFAAMGSPLAHPWIIVLCERLLEGDGPTLKLLRSNPFPDRPPRYVRASLYRYRFTTWAERRATGAWWVRTYVGEYLPPMRLEPRAGARPGG
jgi:hypothetical protein